MPRNSSGTYTLPPGNPVAPNTLIETNWANPTLGDVASAITDSLDRLGRGTMLAPLKIFDGTVFAPALSFNSEATTGIYRPAANSLGIAVGGALIARFSAASVDVLTALSIAGAVGITGALSLSGPVGIGAAPEAPYRLDISHTAAAETRLRSTSPTSYASAYIGNDIGTTARSLSLLYSGSAWPSATIVGGPVGEQANVATIGAFPLVLGTANTARVTIDGVSGALGVGVLSSPWNGANYKVIDLNNRGLSLAGGVDSASIAQGVYNDAAWKYKGTTAFGVSRLDFFDGDFVYSSGPAGTGGAAVTFTERFRVDGPTGNVGIGVVPGGAFRLDVGGSAVTNAAFRSTSSTGYTGVRWFNDVGRTLEINYSGSAYPGVLLAAGPIGEQGSVATVGNLPLVLGTNNTARVVIDGTNGNVGIGAVPIPSAKLYVLGDITAERAAGIDGKIALTTTAKQNTVMGFNDSGVTNAYLVPTNFAYFGNLNGYSLAFTTGNTLGATLSGAGLFNLVSGTGSLRIGGGITRFESAELATPVGAVTTTAAHGGPRAPDVYYAVMRCKIAEHGWAVGQEVVPQTTGGSWNYQLSSNATNVVFQVTASGGAVVIYSATNALVTCTVANWRVVLRALWL